MPRINTHDPATAFFSNPYEAANFRIDVDRFARMVRGQLEPGPRKIVTRASHHELANLVRQRQPLSCDIETKPDNREQPWTGKDVMRCRLKTIGFGTCDEAISFLWDDADTTLRDMVAEVLYDPAVKKVFHNGPWFDVPVLLRYGMKCIGYDDTRDMRRALSATSKLSLRYLASIYTDMPNWKDANDDDAEKMWASDRDDDLMRYNALDCIVTARIYRKMCAEMEATAW